MATAKPGFATQQEAYQALLGAGASPDVALILAAVTRPESSGYTAATNNFQGHGFYGLWQIEDAHGFDNARLRSDDIAYQAQAALRVYQEQGFGAWETYTNGSYRKYLDQTPNALMLAHVNALTAAAGVGAASAQGASEGAQQATAQPLLASGPSPLDSPGTTASAISSPDTTASIIDSPGSRPGVLDSPGQNTASGNPLDDPLGFDKSVSPSGV